MQCRLSKPQPHADLRMRQNSRISLKQIKRKQTELKSEKDCEARVEDRSQMNLRRYQKHPEKRNSETITKP